MGEIYFLFINLNICANKEESSFITESFLPEKNHFSSHKGILSEYLNFKLKKVSKVCHCFTV